MAEMGQVVGSAVADWLPLRGQSPAIVPLLETASNKRTYCSCNMYQSSRICGVCFAKKTPRTAAAGAKFLSGVVSDNDQRRDFAPN